MLQDSRWDLLLATTVLARDARRLALSIIDPTSALPLGTHPEPLPRDPILTCKIGISDVTVPRGYLRFRGHIYGSRGGFYGSEGCFYGS